MLKMYEVCGHTLENTAREPWLKREELQLKSGTPEDLTADRAPKKFKLCSQNLNYVPNIQV